MIKNLPAYFSRGPTESEGMTTRTAVIIWTRDFIYSGNILHFQSERLLDVLNQGSKGDQPDLPRDFLPLHEVQMNLRGGQRKTVSSNCLLVKSSLLFVGQEMAGQTEIAPGERRKSDGFLAKITIGVEIHLAGFCITGQMHIEPWQRLIGALDDERKFIPITGARITTIANEGSSECQFVAVNRSQINCIAATDCQRGVKTHNRSWISS